jgi:hypothetical protein
MKNVSIQINVPKKNSQSGSVMWGNIELSGYLMNVSGPVPLVLDLRIVHG